MSWPKVLLYYGTACILTVIIETVFFRLFGWKNRADLIIIALANVVTNVTLNLFLSLVPGAHEPVWIALLELAVVASEYLIYRRAFGASGKLLPVTFFANILSFLVGAYLYNEVFFL